jgi:hypothetical protein
MKARDSRRGYSNHLHFTRSRNGRRSTLIAHEGHLAGPFGSVGSRIDPFVTLRFSTAPLRGNMGRQERREQHVQNESPSCEPPRVSSKTLCAELPIHMQVRRNGGDACSGSITTARSESRRSYAEFGEDAYPLQEVRMPESINAQRRLNKATYASTKSDRPVQTSRGASKGAFVASLAIRPVEVQGLKRTLPEQGPRIYLGSRMTSSTEVRREEYRYTLNRLFVAGSGATLWPSFRACQSEMNRRSDVTPPPRDFTWFPRLCAYICIYICRRP